MAVSIQAGGVQPMVYRMDRLRSGMVYGCGALFLLIGGLPLMAVAEEPVMLIFTLLFIGMAALMFAIGYLPRLTLGEQELEIRRFRSVVRIPYADIEAIGLDRGEEGLVLREASNDRWAVQQSLFGGMRLRGVAFYGDHVRPFVEARRWVDLRAFANALRAAEFVQYLRGRNSAIVASSLAVREDADTETGNMSALIGVIIGVCLVVGFVLEGEDSTYTNQIFLTTLAVVFFGSLGGVALRLRISWRDQGLGYYVFWIALGITQFLLGILCLSAAFGDG
ncbi:MAG: hypothetical protein H6994_11935 [Pseudomonadales bacterium]|nr:hypothetical protein [Pseudomonadales bacterium]